MQRMTMDGVTYRSLEGFNLPKAVLNLGLRREASPVVRNFVRLVREAARDFPADTRKADVHGCRSKSKRPL
jgi:hypothetical protein